jgi:protein ImuB
MYAALHGSGNLLALAFEFSPFVEQSSLDTVVLDTSGLDRLFGPPHEVAAALSRRAAEAGIRVNIAMAANPDTAIHAARGFRGIHIVPHGDEAKYLGPLPLTLLAPSPELLETLYRWGIHRFHELAALPALGIAERLGPEGLRLHEQARGGWTRKLLLVEDAPRFEAALDLDNPVEALEPLAFLFARLLNGLCTSLATRGFATHELALQLRLEDRTVHERTLRLPVPSLDAKAFLKLLQLDLEAHPPAAPVVHLWMRVTPAKPRAAQHGLFVPMAPEPVKLELTLARIAALVGPGCVGSPELIDAHRPGAFRMTRFGESKPLAPLAVATAVSTAPRLTLRVYRPPRAAYVTIDNGHPSHLAADGIRGDIVSLAGPWRTSGDWWTEDPWARDEWDIALSGGAVYRIYCCSRGWFVEGSYD